MANFEGEYCQKCGRPTVVTFTPVGRLRAGRLWLSGKSLLTTAEITRAPCRLWMAGLLD